MAIDITGKIVDSIVNKVPQKTVKSEWLQKTIKEAGKLSTPANRFFLGAVALSTQPLIDLHNKDVDEKTRKMSCARTIAKIIAGTTTGVLIRWGCIKSIDALTRTPKELMKINKKATKWNTALIPNLVESAKGKKDWAKFTEKEFGEGLRLVKKHREAVGSIAALFVMLVTNFALDVPITKFLTNLFIDKYKINDDSNKMKGGN